MGNSPCTRWHLITETFTVDSLEECSVEGMAVACAVIYATGKHTSCLSWGGSEGSEGKQ